MEVKRPYHTKGSPCNSLRPLDTRSCKVTLWCDKGFRLCPVHDHTVYRVGTLHDHRRQQEWRLQGMLFNVPIVITKLQCCYNVIAMFLKILFFKPSWCSWSTSSQCIAMYCIYFKMIFHYCIGILMPIHFFIFTQVIYYADFWWFFLL